jgi:hypothetical protein
MKPQNPLVLASLALGLSLLPTSKLQAFPIGGATFKDDAPFQGAGGVHSLTSADGLFTIEAWADTDATIPANLYQWWWILGVDSGTGNGALLDGTESLTIQFDRSVGASEISFLYTGGGGGTTSLAEIRISGFLSDPGAYATINQQQRISNLTYANGTLSFDYLWDGAGDYGQLLFSNPAASTAQRLKITGAISPNGDATGWGAALFRVSCQQIYGAPTLEPVSVRHNFQNSYTTPDGGLAVRGYSDANATTSANLGTYLDQCFGVYGGKNTGAIDGSESITLQFAAGIGLSRLDAIYSSGNITISGFASDPGFTDFSGAATGVSYSDGALTFTLSNGGHHMFFFTNRVASAGRTLRINVDPADGNELAIAGVEYVDSKTLIAADIPSNVATTHATADGLLTLTGFADTPGTTPANLYENVDWFGIAGGNNTETIDGTESLQLQFSGTAGLSSVGTRYTSGQIIISGFASDPGLSDPCGTATDVSYSDGTLSYTFNAPRSPENVVNFTKLSASSGRTLVMRTDGAAGSQIALTRVRYAAGSESVTLSLSKSGDSIVLSWPVGTLQQSTTVNGEYSDVSGAASPYTISASDPQKFFRVKVQ